jgi:hypothetical protein
MNQVLSGCGGGCACGAGGDARRGWPAEATGAVAAARTAPAARFDRRREARVRYEARAVLVPDGHLPGLAGPTLYVRDAEPRAVGFVATEPLVPGARFVLHVPSPDGSIHMELPCHVGRCRALDSGWYEGVLLLCDEQPAFAEERLTGMGC